MPNGYYPYNFYGYLDPLGLAIVQDDSTFYLPTHPLTLFDASNHTQTQISINGFDDTETPAHLAYHLKSFPGPPNTQQHDDPLPELSNENHTIDKKHLFE